MTADTCTYQISSLAQLKMRYKFKKSKTKCVQVYMFIQCLMLSCHSVINQSNRFYFRIRNGIFFVCVCYNVAWYVAHTQLVFCRCGFLRAWHYPFLHINKGTHTHTHIQMSDPTLSCDLVKRNCTSETVYAKLKTVQWNPWEIWCNAKHFVLHELGMCFKNPKPMLLSNSSC